MTTDTVLDPLLCDLLSWLAAADRRYVEVMEAWRTSCPRLPVWESAIDSGFVAHRCDGTEAMVGITPAGRTFLERHAPRCAPATGGIGLGV